MKQKRWMDDTGCWELLCWSQPGQGTLHEPWTPAQAAHLCGVEFTPWKHWNSGHSSVKVFWVLFGLAKFLPNNYTKNDVNGKQQKWCLSAFLFYHIEIGDRSHYKLWKSKRKAVKKLISYKRKGDEFTSHLHILATFPSREAGWNHSLLRSSKREAWRKISWK